MINNDINYIMIRNLDDNKVGLTLLPYSSDRILFVSGVYLIYFNMKIYPIEST
jgi:hypothetical protein